MLYKVRAGSVYVTGVSLHGDEVTNVEIDGSIVSGSYLDMGKGVADLVAEYTCGVVEEVS